MKETYNCTPKKELIKLLKKRDDRIEKLANENCQLQRRLLAYENAHTPPSKQRFNIKKEKLKSGKLGAPIGHPKYERKEPTPNMTIKYTEDECPHCKSKLNNPFEIKRILEEEIPNPQPVNVTEHLVGHYFCPQCQKKVIAKNNAPRGCFGKNIQTHVALLKFEDRLPLRKVESSLLRNHKIKITNPGIYGITKQVSRKLENNYYKIIKRIRNAKIIYADETKYKLNGETWWLWTFVCDDSVLFVIRKSRGKKVIEEILGKEFRGIIVSDGWIVYSKFAKILQRCWAHLLRECDKLEEDYNDFNFKNKQIHKLFNEIYMIRNNIPPDEERVDLQIKMKKRLEFIARNMLNDFRFKVLGTKILNGINSWFTCVVHTDVEPTNNFAEQALRELVIQRKIMGGLRSRDGAVILERIVTCLSTWKKQGKPLFETLRNCL